MKKYLSLPLMRKVSFAKQNSEGEMGPKPHECVFLTTPQSLRDSSPDKGSQGQSVLRSLFLIP